MHAALKLPCNHSSVLDDRHLTRWACFRSSELGQLGTQLGTVVAPLVSSGSGGG